MSNASVEKAIQGAAGTWLMAQTGVTNEMQQAPRTNKPFAFVHCLLLFLLFPPFMTFTPRSVLVAALLASASHVAAVHLKVRGEHSSRTPVQSSGFSKRDHLSGLTNGNNIDYYTNITLGSSSFKVLIDTGRFVFLSHHATIDRGSSQSSTQLRFIRGGHRVRR